VTLTGNSVERTQCWW